MFRVLVFLVTPKARITAGTSGRLWSLYVSMLKLWNVDFLKQVSFVTWVLEVLLQPPLVLLQLGTAHKLPPLKVRPLWHIHYRLHSWISGGDHRDMFQNSQGREVLSLYVDKVLPSRAKLPTQREVSEWPCCAVWGVCHQRLEWNTGMSFSIFNILETTMPHTWRRSLKSRATSFFIPETLLVNFCIVSQPKGEIWRNLMYIFR